MTQSLIARFLNDEFNTYDEFTAAYDAELLGQLLDEPAPRKVLTQEETTKNLNEIMELFAKFYQLQMGSNTPLLSIAEVRRSNRKHYTRQAASRTLLNAKCRDFREEFEAQRNREVQTEFDSAIGTVLEAINRRLKEKIENPDWIDDTEALKYYERVLLEELDLRLALINQNISDLKIVRHPQLAPLHV